MQKWKNWIHERFPLTTWIKWALKEEIPGGASFSYSLGSAALFLFFLLVLTGIWQMFVYVPTIDHAYDSLSYLRLNVPFGWLIHGLHYWGATAFSVVVGLHAIRVFFWGAYKKPREMVWLSGVILLLLAAGFMFTGPILPWDKKGYWACKVGLGMVGDVPWIGTFLQNLFQGEASLGQATLSRMFVIHVAVLPAIITVMIAAHLIAFRIFGGAGSWKKEKNQTIKGNFWPEQIFKDMVIAVAVFLLILGLTVFVRPPFGGVADPLDTTYVPKPEWNFMFIYQFLKYFKGVWEPVGIVGIPLFILLFLGSLPFLDKNPERSPSKRRFVIVFGGLFVAWVLAMTTWGFFTHPPSEEASQLAQEKNKKRPETELKPVAVSPEQGKKLFLANACNTCHSVSGKPSNKAGPDLVLALSQRKNLTSDWLRIQIVSPKTHNPNSLMPAYTHLTKKEVQALIAYLQSLKTKVKEEKGAVQKNPQQQKNSHVREAVNLVGNAANGKVLYNLYCMQCHGPGGENEAKGFHPVQGAPSLKPIQRAFYSEDVQTFLKNIDPVVQHGSANPQGGPDMPAFGDSGVLTQAQIADIEAYILQLNRVDRTKIVHPGIDPVSFFFLFLAVTAIACLILFFLYVKAKNGRK